MSRPADYIVVRDGVVVQEISALNAKSAIAARVAKGDLYTYVREDDYESREIDELLASIGEGVTAKGESMITTGTIGRFSGPYAFLSNFAKSPIQLPSWHPAFGYWADTVEHAFQSAKVATHSSGVWVVGASTAREAKQRGRQIDLRPEWDEVRNIVMVNLLRLKFAPGSAMAQQLLQTGNALLVEGNSWNDTYWGVCNGEGENWLGRSLMLVRAELDVFGAERAHLTGQLTR